MSITYHWSVTSQPAGASAVLATPNAATTAVSGLTVAGDALALPFATDSVDVVTCSQVLHHFEQGDSLRLLGELTRVARRRVIVAELRRSRTAAAGLWLV